MGKGQRCVANRNVSTYKSKTVKIKWKSSFQKKKGKRGIMEYGANVFLII